MKASDRLAVAAALARLFSPHRDNSYLLNRSINQMSNKVLQILKEVSKSHFAAQKRNTVGYVPGVSGVITIFPKHPEFVVSDCSMLRPHDQTNVPLVDISTLVAAPLYSFLQFTLRVLSGENIVIPFGFQTITHLSVSDEL